MNENKDYITKAAEKGNINISIDVISAVAAAATLEVEGVASLTGFSGKDIKAFLSVKKNNGKGIKIEVEEESIRIDVSVMLDIGAEIIPVSTKIQEAVKEAVEASAGLTVSAVGVRVSGLAIGK